jgi:large subunit ribosomal protein L30
MAKSDKQVKVTLVRSVLGRPAKHKRVVLALGLKRTNRSVVLPDNDIVRGMINKVSHLVVAEAV